MHQNKKIHESVYAPFCPDISTYPSIDYSNVAEKALKAYPGAKTLEQALIYTVKHQEMSIKKAKNHYSEQAHLLDNYYYSKNWINRYLEYMNDAKND